MRSRGIQPPEAAERLKPAWSEARRAWTDTLALRVLQAELLVHAALSHEHIVRVMDVIDVVDATYIVMQRVDGPELTDFIEMQPMRRVPPTAVLTPCPSWPAAARPPAASRREDARGCGWRTAASGRGGLPRLAGDDYGNWPGMTTAIGRG